MAQYCFSFEFYFQDPKDTPWTNSSLVSVSGYPTYGSKPTADANTTVSLFAQSMNNMLLNFTFDYAAAIIKYLKENIFKIKKSNSFYFESSLDIWYSDSSQTPQTRSSVTGYTISNGGICSGNKYSILEFNGFNEIENSAHELGHRY